MQRFRAEEDVFAVSDVQMMLATAQRVCNLHPSTEGFTCNTLVEMPGLLSTTHASRNARDIHMLFTDIYGPYWDRDEVNGLWDPSYTLDVHATLVKGLPVPSDAKGGLTSAVKSFLRT